MVSLQIVYEMSSTCRTTMSVRHCGNYTRIQCEIDTSVYFHSYPLKVNELVSFQKRLSGATNYKVFRGMKKMMIRNSLFY
jgi:hypothetical protein